MARASARRGTPRPRRGPRRPGGPAVLREGLALLDRLGEVSAENPTPLDAAETWLDRFEVGSGPNTHPSLPEALAVVTSVLIESPPARAENRTSALDERARAIRALAAGLATKLLRLPAWAPVREEVEEHLLPLVNAAVDRGYAHRVGLIGSLFERIRALGHHTPNALVRSLSERTYRYKFPRFGTSGIRGTWGADITHDRASAVTDALVDFLAREAPASQGHLIVGFDTRLHADELAEWVVAALRRRGCEVHLSQGPLPTPVLNYWATRVEPEGLRGLLMCTASHNPPEWHGIKFTPATGLPATAAITDWVGSRANRILLERALGAPRKEPPSKRLGGLQRFDPRASYVEWVLSPTHPLPIHPDRIRSWFGDKLVVVDEMHGAGAGYLPAILERLGIPYAVVHGTASPTFGRLAYPAPEPPHSSALQEVVERLAAQVGLAMDADADRFGVIDPAGRFVHPSQVVAVLTDFLVNQRQSAGKVVRSLTCSTAVDDVLRSGLDVRRTRIPEATAIPAYVRGPQHLVTRGHLASLAGGPSFLTMVGIKYLMEAGRMDAQYRVPPGATTSDFVIAGEESGGITTGGHVNDKDGVWANLVVLDAMAHYRRPFGAVWADLARTAGREWHLGRVDLDGPDEVKDALVTRFLVGVPAETTLPAAFGGVTLDFAGGILHDYVELRFQRDGQLVARLIVRGSGTEPICRAYTEATDDALRGALEGWVVAEYDRLAATFLGACRSSWRLLELLLCTLPTPATQRAVSDRVRELTSRDPHNARRLPEELVRLSALADTRKREVARLWIPLVRRMLPPDDPAPPRARVPGARAARTARRSSGIARRARGRPSGRTGSGT